MQIAFGSYTFETDSKPRESGSTLVVSFFPGEMSFESVKELLHSPVNTQSVVLIDGQHETEYHNFTVYKELQFHDKGEVIVATATLNKEDLATQVRRLADAVEAQGVSIEDTNNAIDEIMTVVIPELLFQEPVDDEVEGA